MSESGEHTKKLVGIEVSTATLLAVCADGDGKIVDSFKADRFDGRDPLDRIAAFVNEVKNRFGDFPAVGIAVPGLIDRESGNVAYSANIPEHSSLNIAEAVRSVTELKVVVENDANAAAYGEYKFGAGRSGENMFYATIGRGVGGAFIIDGKIWHGTSGYAGEFGYIAINSEGMRLEDVASSSNIVRRTRNRFGRDSTSSLGSLPEERIDISEILKAADDGDDFARLMLERTGMYVGTAIASVINLLNIEKIVVGGEITHPFVIEAIIGRAKEFSFARSFEKTEIVQGELGENAAAIGVALIANENQS
jgi:glucokinase